MSKRKRPGPGRRGAAPAATARPRPPRRFIAANAVAFALAALVAPALADPGAHLLALGVLLALTVGAARGARAVGLPPALLAAPATAAAFAAVATVRATVGLSPFADAAPAGLVVFLQTALLAGDLVAARPLRPAAVVTRLGAALERGRAARLVVTLALAVVAVRAVTIAVTTAEDPAFAWAGAAVLAGALLWLRPPPAGTLFATLALALIPGTLTLGLTTDFALWAPLTRPLALACGLAAPHPVGLLLAALAAGVLLLALVATTAARAAASAVEERAAERRPLDSPPATG